MGARDFDRLKGEIDELLADLWQVPRYAGMRRGFRPQVDCYRTDEPPELVVVVELPGVDPDSVEIVADKRALRITGERPRPRRDGLVYQQMEIDYGPFQRIIAFADDVDVAAAQAAYSRGLLTVSLPLAKAAPRETPVKIEVERR